MARGNVIIRVGDLRVITVVNLLEQGKVYDKHQLADLVARLQENNCRSAPYVNLDSQLFPT